MKTRTLLSFGSIVALLILTPVGLLRAESSASGALSKLDQAKTSKHPFLLIEKAKTELEGTDSVKNSRKWAAINDMNKAIDAIRTFEPAVMEKHIERAIHNIKEGLVNAPR